MSKNHLHQHPSPPRWVNRLLEHFCDPHLLEEVQGDLQELYGKWAEKHGVRKARWLYVLHAMKFLRPYTFKRVSKNNPTIMLRNYFLISIRHLRKQGIYSFINIMGLAVGMAACLLIALYIIDELSYDAYYSKSDRIYRLNNEIKFGDNHVKLALCPAPMAHALQQDYPEIESTVRFRNDGSYLVKTTDATENVKENHVIWTDSTFFKIFSVPLIEGDAQSALKEPASVAISQRTADKYFPEGNALGQSLILDNTYHAKVTAVFENLPSTSHFHFDILLAMVGTWPVAQEAQSPLFINENFNTYLLLKEGTNAKLLEAKLPGFIEKYVGPQLAQVLGSDFTMEKFRAAGNKYETTLMSIRDIHLHSDLIGELEPNNPSSYVYLFGLVGLLILAIASINFMNLSTARSGNRAREVGIRKVMGSLRLHLVSQFLMESVLTTLIAFLVALGLVNALLPLFNQLASKQLYLPFSNINFYFILLGASLVIGVLAGLYPAFFLSAFKPMAVLKGRLSLGMKSGWIRSGLVVFQFVITILLMVGTLTIHRQLDFMQRKRLGFEKEQVIVVKDAYALHPNVQSFKNEALQLTSIESGTISGYLPLESPDAARNMNAFWKVGTQPTTGNLVNFQFWSVDEDYIKTFGMHISLGRGFSNEFPSDSTAIVLNEEAVLRLGLGPDPIGKKINTFNDQQGDDPFNPEAVSTYTVIGVLENFHFASFKENVKAVGLFLNRSEGNVSFRFQAHQAQEALASLKKIWKTLAPGQPFQYSFLDEDFGEMYATEQRLGKIFNVFATLAIVIACLGLFALTAFTAEQRTREIGIRKVLGASVSGIVVLLSGEFGKLIFLAFLLAVPLAWYGINWWLQSYAYKAEIGISVYLLSGLITLLIALFTISFQSIKAARANPVKSLRNE